MKLTNIHPTSNVDDTVKVDDQARVGPNCFLSGDITIEAGAVLKGGLTLIGDITVGHHAVVEPGVCIAAQMSEGNDYPARVHIGHHVHVGAGTVLASGVSVGQSAWIEAGTYVSRNIPPHAIVGGNPASIRGYSIYRADTASDAVRPPSSAGIHASAVAGVTVHHFNRIRDLRGDLSAGEFERNVPFLPKRYFIVYDVPSTETRGEHAHRLCHQFLVCVAGSVSVLVDDGVSRDEVLLDRPNMGLYIPAGIWGVQYKYSSDGTLLVFASEYYDSTDYIRDYDEFLEFRGVVA